MEQEIRSLLNDDILQKCAGTFGFRREELTLFDFDECEYNWFAADIANPLFYATPLKSNGIELRNRAAQRFYDYFMEGYFSRAFAIDLLAAKIPLFLRLREILVYSGAFRSLTTCIHGLKK
ncbi:hypothetical protein FE783_06940 [Paenibacillus mesophilus]|uniref:hypothetical protein n=1 Tax=Paenibacillus mesophilus TaxID=2582849 RepID=UPI00110F497F|nr:hypothetical protein [Paenibacillus mesophilus]TMV51506.1 hypothetical protein FE783_06940 [Paenibacillus mesophilus]